MSYSIEKPEKIKASSLLGFIHVEKAKTESGQPIDFTYHRYLLDIYNEDSQHLVVQKAAQIGLSTLQIFRALWRAYYDNLDIIYVLPTLSDVHDFVGGKVDRIIEQNTDMQTWVADKDSVEQKRVGKSSIYFRGSWVERQALMISADELMLDEYDRSDLSVLETYESRLQHSSHRNISIFSNPSRPGYGVSQKYEESDKRLFHIKHSCGSVFPFDESCIDYAGKRYACPKCSRTITEDERMTGFWQSTADFDKWRGYKIPLWLNALVPAGEIVLHKTNKSPEYFANFVAAEPYVSKDNSISVEEVLANCTDKVNPMTSRVVIGVDTGLPIWYVCANKDGFFYHGHCNNYADLRTLLNRWPDSVLVSDQGGDLIGIRELQQEYPGRVFLAYYRKDQANVDVVRWGEGNEYGKVLVDRNRMISLMVGQMKDKGRFVLNGQRDEWQLVAEHFANMYRQLILAPDKPGHDSRSLYGAEYVWKRKGGDHLAHATLYALVGLSKFADPVQFLTMSDTFQEIAESSGLVYDSDANIWNTI